VLVRSAIASLEGRQTVSARLRHQVHLYDKDIAGFGVYLQGPWQRRLLRMELRVQIGNRLTSMLQVCDGARLWTHSTVSKEPTLTKIELQRLDEDLQAAPPMSDQAAPMTDTFGLGGLPRLLRSLERSFQFGDIREGTLDEVPVLVVRGDWKTAELARLLPDRQEALAADPAAVLAALPVQVPHHVAVYFGRNDLFPYRIEYWPSPRVPKESQVSSGGGNGPPTAQQPLVRLEFFEVRLNEPVDTGQFVYLPPGQLKVKDVTGKYLTKIAERRDPPPDPPSRNPPSGKPPSRKPGAASR
jgi:hypothetical protein